ncbi:MAG: hypothetical protein FWB78_12390 [Treponema sp.]|nr:hypothetical protein [Treponema sp.]
MIKQLKNCVTVVFLLVLSLRWGNAEEMAELKIIHWDGASELRQYPVNAEKFGTYFGKTVVEIVGLENFPNLRELWFSRVPFMRDFNFLRGLDALETLVFFLVTITDIDFLYDLTSLRELVFQGASLEGKIDASRLPNLEYFEFSQSRLTNLPIKIVERGNINTINISGNNITDISSVYDMGILVLVHVNPIPNTGNPNILTGGWDVFFRSLPERYRRFLP